MQIVGPTSTYSGGKGGWDSGEIETGGASNISAGSGGGKGGWDSGEIETTKTRLLMHGNLVERVDGTQARLKQGIVQRNISSGWRGKGGWDSGEIETAML